MWLVDPKTKEKSVTLTLLVMTFCVALLKILISGVVIRSNIMGEFSGSDFATMVGSVGALYGFRKHTDKDKKETL